MRVNIKAILTLLSVVALNLSASTLYVKESVKLNSVDLFYGIVVDKEDNNIKVDGFRKSDSNEIFATKNLSLLIATVKDANIIKVISKEADIEHVSLNFELDDEYLSEDYYDAWEEKEEIFLEKCSQCHAAPEIGAHTMLEWEGLFGSMKNFAQPTKDEETLILRYLKTFAKDGIIEEE